MKSWKIIVLWILSFVIYADILSSNLMQVNNYSIYRTKNIWQRLKDGFALEHYSNNEIDKYEIVFSHSSQFIEILNGAIPYLYFIINELERRGIPTEIALIPFIESKYDPFAQSKTGIAKGMWQFEEKTSKRFDLKSTDEIEERMDIIKSSLAAINYLQYLHELFKDWELAIVAYNLGEGAVYKAIKEAGNKNIKNLRIRELSRNYIYKIIALANIIDNPAKYKIKINKFPNSPYFLIAKITDNMSIRKFNSLACIDMEEFQELNPSFLKYNTVLTPKSLVLIPYENYSLYASNVNYFIKENDIQLVLKDIAKEEESSSSSSHIVIANSEIIKENKNNYSDINPKDDLDNLIDNLK